MSIHKKKMTLNHMTNPINIKKWIQSTWKGNILNSLKKDMYNSHEKVENNTT